MLSHSEAELADLEMKIVKKEATMAATVAQLERESEQERAEEKEKEKEKEKEQAKRMQRKPVSPTRATLASSSSHPRPSKARKLMM